MQVNPHHAIRKAKVGEHHGLRSPPAMEQTTTLPLRANGSVRRAMAWLGVAVFIVSLGYGAGLPLLKPPSHSSFSLPCGAGCRTSTGATWC
jgi:hypothetical protein